MILHSIRILCASTSEPDVPLTFVWQAGDEIFSIECAITKLQEYVDQHKTPLAVASEQPPILNAS